MSCISQGFQVYLAAFLCMVYRVSRFGWQCSARLLSLCFVFVCEPICISILRYSF